MDAGLWVILVPVLYVIPLYISLRTYLLVRLPDYFILFMVYLLSLFYIIVYIFVPNLHALQTGLLGLVLFFLYEVAIHMSDKQLITRQLYYPVAILLYIIAEVTEFIVLISPITNEIIHVLFIEIFRSMTSLQFTYSMYHANIYFPTRKTQLTRRAWLFAGVILLTMSLIRVISIMTIIPQAATLTPDEFLVLPLVQLSEVGILLGVTLLGIIASGIIIYAPELLLISHVQLLRSTQLYNLTQKYNTPSGDSSPFLLSSLFDYLHEIDLDKINENDR